MSKKTALTNPPDLTPGVPGPEEPTLAEATDPRGPLPPKADQVGPDTLTPTGVQTGAAPTDVGQQGAFLTTAHGHRLADSDRSLRAGRRGPTLLQDHHLREKISHFDHERIPERAVHARGAGAHGLFVANGAARGICQSAFLTDGVETPVFVRFSTVLGSRGSADLARDTRGFATRFYTSEGNYDLVGNNIPVFFIQDGIKFPDLVHAAKPTPDREIPQAQSAHDSFWDFASLHTEAQAHTMWNMSDRGLPRSYRTMQGFGVHTWRVINEAGETSLVKFHWQPRQGVHSVTWEEALLTNGTDPDFHRRDLADAIEAGAYPIWDLGVQVMPDNAEQTFEGIDLLDSTKFVPEELAPVQVIGTMTLTGNPTNYFAETEQVAFNLSNLVPGIDVTDDPLLQSRLFSYLDTQITRLGGPNWNQLPINRPHAPVNDNLRDGHGQQAVHGGGAPYRPNTLGGGCPFVAGVGDGAFIDVPVEVVAGQKVREHPASYDDHFSQVSLFYASLSPLEQEHVIGAYTFELAKCFEHVIRERQLQALANIDPELCQRVAAGLGMPVPVPTIELSEVTPSAALTQMGGTWPIAGRQVGIVVGTDSDQDQVQQLLAALQAESVTGLVVGPHGGKLGELTVHRTYATVASTELDAVIVVGQTPPAPDVLPAQLAVADGTAVDPRVVMLLEQCWRHAKAIGAVPDADGAPATAAAGLPADAAGVVTGPSRQVADGLLALLAGHRAWERLEVA